MRGKRPLLLGIGLGILGLGFVRWPVTAPVRGFLERWGRQRGWVLTVEEARWRPWGELELADLRVRAPQGGRLQLARVRVRPQPAAWVIGRLVTEWDLGAIRMDPSSWGIHSALVQELLSAGPVTTTGSAELQLQPGRLTLKRFLLDGRLLQLRAAGWLTDQQEAQLSLEGALAREVLEGMKWDGAGGAGKEWEPFQMQLRGSLPRPTVLFNSQFLSFAMNRPAGEGS